MAGLFPALLKVEGRLCVIVGGGEVALRKAVTLVGRGARVKVISPVLAPELAKLAESGILEWERGPYRPGALAGAFLCVAAADDPAVNRAARDEAGELKVLVNVVDDPEGSDFQVPSFFEDGPLLVALSTSGESPAAARTLRRMIQAYLGPHFGEALARIGEFREQRVKSELESAKLRGAFWEQAVTPDLLELVRSGELAKMMSRLEESLMRFKAREADE